MKKPHEMTFSEFAETVRPSGAVNRMPQLGTGQDVLTYSVYMNGPVADELSVDAQEHHYRDVMLHALTEKLGLNPDAFRDNLKVAELVATRSAWMTAVLDASVQRSPAGAAYRLSQEVVHDYEMITEGLSHPWIQQQIRAQQSLSQNLRPALQAAEVVVGGSVVERVPDEITTGTIVSQNLDFTVQAIGDGEVVAHENRRLAAVPAVGQNVTVTYYRGNGQVFENSQDLQVSAPFIDQKSGDLAVHLLDRENNVQQVVLFNGVASLAKFVEEQGLDPKLVEQGIEVRTANPKTIATPPKPERTPASEMYIDDKSGCLAFDYLEGGGQHTVLFGSVQALEQYAHEFKIDAKRIEQARTLEAAQNVGRGDPIGEWSLSEAKQAANRDYEMVSIANKDKGRYMGPVVMETQYHVVQDVGRQAVVIHDKRNLDKVPAVGHRLAVNYEQGRGEVQDRGASKGHGR